MAIDFDSLILPSGGLFTLENDVYVLTRPKKLACRLVGSGASVIRFMVGSPGSAALTTAFGQNTAGSENVVFEVGPGCYALGGEGGFRGLNSQIHGGGGMAHLRGNSHKSQLISWTIVDTVTASYGIYAGPLVEDKPPTFKLIRNCAGLELINCGIQNGVTGKDHGLRFHGCDLVRINGGLYSFKPDPKHYTASLRVHDGKQCEIFGATFSGGNVGFGPLAEGDGGINLPPGEKRDYFAALRLAKLRIKDTTFDGLGMADIKFNRGILDGQLENVNVVNNYGSSLFDTPGGEYLGRPLSVIKIIGGTGTLKSPGGVPKFFSDEAGAKNMRVSGATFQGKPFTH